MRIAVFAENRPFFGALLAHAPLLWELKSRHPGCVITLFAPFPRAEPLVGRGLADELEFYRRAPWPTARRLRGGRFDAIYNLRPATRWLDLAAGVCGARDRRGFDSFLGRRVYTRTVPHDTSIYRPRKYLTLLDDPATAQGSLAGFFRAIAGARGSPGRERRLLVLPGGGEAYKRWGVDRFLGLCDALAVSRPELKPVFVLGPAEADLRGPITAWSASAPSPAEIVASPPLEELAARALGAAAAVGNDCGPGHVAQMCGVPFVCVMSDRDGRGPERRAEWIDAGNHPLSVLSRPGEPLASVEPVEVLAAVERALARGDRRATV